MAGCLIDKLANQVQQSFLNSFMLMLLLSDANDDLNLVAVCCFLNLKLVASS